MLMSWGLNMAVAVTVLDLGVVLLHFWQWSSSSSSCTSLDLQWWHSHCTAIDDPVMVPTVCFVFVFCCHCYKNNKTLLC
jgi:hypothetical protein